MAEFQYLHGLNSMVQDMQAEAYLYASSGTVGIAATGVIDGLVVTQALTANGTVLIGTGACINQASLGQGGSRLINPSQKTLDIFTANPMGGLPRNDIVVFDSITATILAIIGVPNATPTDPTVPATAVALARLRNLASATTIPTAQIDNLIVATTLRGVVTLPDPKLNVTLAGSSLVTTSASGNVLIAFGVTFASAPVVVACNGDGGTHNNMSVGLYSSTATTTTNTTVSCRVGETGGIVASTSVRINWTATGNLA